MGERHMRKEHIVLTHSEIHALLPRPKYSIMHADLNLVSAQFLKFFNWMEEHNEATLPDYYIFHGREKLLKIAKELKCPTNVIRLYSYPKP